MILELIHSLLQVDFPEFEFQLKGSSIVSNYKNLDIQINSWFIKGEQTYALRRIYPDDFYYCIEFKEVQELFNYLDRFRHCYTALRLELDHIGLTFGRLANTGEVQLMHKI